MLVLTSVGVLLEAFSDWAVWAGFNLGWVPVRWTLFFRTVIQRA